VNSGCCTWREFAEEAARILGRQPKLAAMTLDAMAFRAKRPKYCALSNALLASHGIAMPDWRDALARCIARGVS
jgi:dTDP-4-dehydrorhamnose reductase